MATTSYNLPHQQVHGQSYQRRKSSGMAGELADPAGEEGSQDDLNNNLDQIPDHQIAPGANAKNNRALAVS